MTDSSGFLTTHVLDTANGCPAAGVGLTVFSIKENERTMIAQSVTNDDGRTEQPLIPKGALSAGVYEIVFDVAAYFGAQDAPKSVPFLDLVPLRFGIDDATQHYHVPLLVSPYGYSTYRGS